MESHVTRDKNNATVLRLTAVIMMMFCLLLLFCYLSPQSTRQYLLKMAMVQGDHVNLRALEKLRRSALFEFFGWDGTLYYLR